MTGPEIFAVVVALLSLLWNVANAAKLREHSRALQVSEASLRVASELKLRLHQQGWDLIRATQEAASAAFEAIRTYQLAAIAHSMGQGEGIRGKEHMAADMAVQKFSGLAHVAPPAKVELREASSAFAMALNLVNHSLLGGPAPNEQVSEVLNLLNQALGAAAAGTKAWNKELWQHQTVVGLAKVDADT